MPKGLHWNMYERQLACRAWVRASCNATRGADQRTETFSASVCSNLKDIEPTEYDEIRFSKRGARNIVAFIRETIAPDVQKFQTCMKIVERSHPTGGVNATDCHCMATAIYLGKTAGIDYSYVPGGRNSLDPKTEWINFLAFFEVKDCPKFNLDPITASKRKKAVDNNSIDDSFSTSNNKQSSNDKQYKQLIEQSDDEFKIKSNDNLLNSNSSYRYARKKKSKTLNDEAKEKENLAKSREESKEKVKTIVENNTKLLKLYEINTNQGAIKEKIALLKIQYDYYISISDTTNAALIQKEIFEMTQVAIKSLDTFLSKKKEINNEVVVVDDEVIVEDTTTTPMRNNDNKSSINDEVEVLYYENHDNDIPMIVNNTIIEDPTIDDDESSSDSFLYKVSLGKIRNKGSKVPNDIVINDNYHVKDINSIELNIKDNNHIEQIFNNNRTINQNICNDSNNNYNNNNYNYSNDINTINDINNNNINRCNINNNIDINTINDINYKNKHLDINTIKEINRNNINRCINNNNIDINKITDNNFNNMNRCIENYSNKVINDCMVPPNNNNMVPPNNNNMVPYNYNYLSANIIRENINVGYLKEVNSLLVSKMAVHRSENKDDKLPNNVGNIQYNRNVLGNVDINYNHNVNNIGTYKDTCNIIDKSIINITSEEQGSRIVYEEKVESKIVPKVVQDNIDNINPHVIKVNKTKIGKEKVIKIGKEKVIKIVKPKVKKAVKVSDDANI